MEKLNVKLSAIFGVSLFGTLSVISAIGLVTVGVYAILEEGIVLSIKTPLWVGGAVFVGGILTIGIALCGKVSYFQSLVLLVISSASFLLCFASMILLEFVEKEKIFRPTRNKDTGPVTSETLWRSPYLIYLVYLISSVIGMVSAVVGFLYIYCIFIAPVRNQQWKSYQTQILGQDQYKGQHHRTRTKYKFKSSPARQRSKKTKIRTKEHKNDLPESSWIYETQSIHSLTATPTRVLPTKKDIQLKKDVVKELRHNSTFKVHRYQTQPNPTPPHPVPPPLPPITPSALAPVPTLPGQAKRIGVGDRQPCTAKSLEPYPIPRKYSLRGSSRRSNHGRQHPGTFRQLSPKEQGNAGGEAMNLAGQHDSLANASMQNFGQEHGQGNIDEHDSTFQDRSAKASTDQKFVAPCLQADPLALQTPQQEASNVIHLKPVPVKRRGSKLSSAHHPSLTLPGYDQIRTPSSCPPQDSGHTEGQCGLSPAPIQHQEREMAHQKPARHFYGEMNGKMQVESVQKGHTVSQGNPWEVSQGQEATTDQQVHPVPHKRSVHAAQTQVKAMYIQESAWETEAPEMTQTQIHQLYQSSQKGETKLDVPGQQNPKHQEYLIIQNPSMHQDDSTTDPPMHSFEQQSGQPVAPPRPSSKPKLHHQSNVEEASEGPPAPVLQRKSTRKIHERIQAVQEKLWMADSSSLDSSDHRSEQSSVIPDDEVDHLQPRLAATTGVQIDNMQDFCVTSTRL